MPKIAELQRTKRGFRLVSRLISGTDMSSTPFGGSVCQLALVTLRERISTTVAVLPFRWPAANQKRAARIFNILESGNLFGEFLPPGRTTTFQSRNGQLVNISPQHRKAENLCPAL